MFSVIIPAFNRPEKLYGAVSSVLEQSFKDFELILVDDGSTENLSVVYSQVENAGHKVLRQENAGPAAGICERLELERTCGGIQVRGNRPATFSRPHRR